MESVEDASARPVPASRPKFALKRDSVYLLIVAAVVALDQLTKWMVKASIDPGRTGLDWGFLRIVHFTNSGAAFGMFQDAAPLLAVVSIVGMAAIFVYLFNPGFADPVMRLGLALMLGGAIGNLIGRVTAGEVVDFIKVPNWPAFNVADSSISIGVVLLLWSILRESSRPSNAAS